MAEIDYVHQSNEQRGLRDIVSYVMDAFHTILWRLSMLLKRGPPHHIKPLLIHRQISQAVANKKLMEWLEYMDESKSQGHAVGDVTVVEYLLASVKSRNKLVYFFSWLQKEFPTWKERVNSFERLLAAKDLQYLKLAPGVWMRAATNPDDVYHRMPISAMGSVKGEFSEEGGWPNVRIGLTSWLSYVADFNKCHPDAAYDSTAGVTLLVNERGVDEARQFFITFEDYPKWMSLPLAGKKSYSRCTLTPWS